MSQGLWRGLVALVFACASPPPSEAPKVVAHLNEVPIDGATLMLRALRQYSALSPKDWRPILTRLLEDEIDLRLLANEAKKQKISPAEDTLQRAVASRARRYPIHRFRRSLDRLALRPVDLRQRAMMRLLAQGLLAKEAAKQPIANDAIAAWIAKNPTQEKVLVRHLLTASQSEATEVVALYTKKRFSFADLVRRFSDAPEASQGGLLPPYARGELPAVFDQAFSLKVGALSKPLRSEHGWHLLRLERKDEGGEPSTDVARRSILRTREGALQGQLIARLRRGATLVKVPGAINALSAAMSVAEEAP